MSTLGHVLAVMSEAFGLQWRQQWLRNLFTLEGKEICSMKELFSSGNKQNAGDRNNSYNSNNNNNNPVVLVGVGERTCLAGDSRNVSLTMHRKITASCRKRCYLLSAKEVQVSIQIVRIFIVLLFQCWLGLVEHAILRSRRNSIYR